MSYAIRRVSVLFTCVGALLAGSALTGCNLLQPQDKVEPNPAAPVDALKDPNHPGIEACSAGNVEDELELARDFRSSAHEMIVCGGLAANVGVTLISVFLNASAGGSTSPNGITYNAETMTYAAGDIMDLQLFLGADTSFGKAGDLIPFNVFDLANYGTDLTVGVSAGVDLSGNANASYNLTFSEPGPALELLGLQTGNGTLAFDTQKIEAAFGEIRMSMNVTVEDDHNGDKSVVRYDLGTEMVPLRQFIFDGGSLPMDLKSVSGDRTASKQTLVNNGWTVTFSNAGAGVLEGTLGFNVTGGAFDYSVVYDYPFRSAPDVRLGCL